MTSSDMLSINNVAAKLGLSVHQLRRWELMFGLEIKRGRGQQRQYREEDMSVLERIKELVEQGWPTSQIRPQLEAEGLLTPKLIGAPPAPGNPEVLQEAIIGLRNFSERRFIDLSKQIDELRQLLISVTLKQELSSDRSSPWQPMASEYVPAPKAMPAQEITIGPQISIDPPKSSPMTQSMMGMPARTNQIPPSPTPMAQGGGSGSSDFSQRSMLGGSSSGQPTGESRPTIPDISQAPKPITDALQRSMSTLDSLFKDERNTPGLGPSAGDSSSSTPQTSSTTSSSSLPAVPPVRYSTIPPLPTQPTQSTTSATQTPSVSPSSSPYGAPGATPATPASASSIPSSGPPSTPSSIPASTPSSIPSGVVPMSPAAPLANSSYGQSSSPTISSVNTPAAAPPEGIDNFASADQILPTYAVKTSVEMPAAAPPEPPPSAPQPSAAPQAAASSGWDHAFESTMVDVNAVPPGGLFEESSAAESLLGQSPSLMPGSSPFPIPAQSPPAGYNSERNPFTTITSTNTSAVSGSPTGQPLLGQNETGNPSFIGGGQNLAQTGPLPARTSVESFAPELKEKLIESQSDSTSTELVQVDPATSHAPAPAAPVIQPALPVTAGPQVNFGPNVSAPTPQATPQRMDDNFGLGEVTDQNYLTVLGRALDLIGWSDEQADSYSLKTFGVPHWDELGRSQAEKLVAHLVGLLKDQMAH